jgi:hypothetical protein
MPTALERGEVWLAASRFQLIHRGSGKVLDIPIQPDPFDPAPSLQYQSDVGSQHNLLKLHITIRNIHNE